MCSLKYGVQYGWLNPSIRSIVTVLSSLCLTCFGTPPFPHPRSIWPILSPVRVGPVHEVMTAVVAAASTVYIHAMAHAHMYCVCTYIHIPPQKFPAQDFRRRGSSRSRTKGSCWLLESYYTPLMFLVPRAHCNVPVPFAREQPHISLSRVPLDLWSHSSRRFGSSRFSHMHTHQISNLGLAHSGAARPCTSQTKWKSLLYTEY